MVIKVRELGINHASKILIIGFLDEDGVSYFQIQDSLEYAEQDIRLGMNTYYLEKK